jgi:Uma2 family endonuclease
MGAVTTHPITIEEFEKLDLPDNQQWELHGGEIVGMPFPSRIHKRLQQRICRLLQEAFPAADVLEEYPFRVENTNDERSADVGATTKERGQESADIGPLSGAPELVVEILSPSNTILKMKQYRRLCFQNGTQIFVTVDPEDNTVEVYLDAENRHTLLSVGDTLRLSLFGTEAVIPVRGIFAGITLPETA